MINLNELTSHHPAFHNIVTSYLPHTFAGSPQTSNHSGNNFRQARKCQTIREMTFAKRGNAKPLGKWLSPCAETPNHSGNDFRHARKYQTIPEITFAMRGNAKPFGKRLSPSDRSIKCFDNGFEQEWKFPTLLRDLYSVGTNATILLSSFLFFYKNHTWKMERNYLSLQLIMQY